MGLVIERATLVKSLNHFERGDRDGPAERPYRSHTVANQLETAGGAELRYRVLSVHFAILMSSETAAKKSISVPWTAVLTAYALIVTGLWLHGSLSAQAGSPGPESSPIGVNPLKSTAPSLTSGDPAPPRLITLTDGPSTPASTLPRVDWAALESNDLNVYAQNLRSAGLPERVIRQIMAAEVRTSFDQGRIALLEKDNIPFWDPTYNTEDEMADELSDLAEQEASVLASLVGPLDDATVDEINSRRPKQAFRFGNEMNAEKKQALARVFDRAREAIQRAPADNESLADELRRIDAQQESELATLLTPQEREDFEIRNSTLASEIRRSIRQRVGRVNEEQFRRLFRLRQDLAGLITASAGTGEDVTPFFEYFDAQVSEAVNGEDPTLISEHFDAQVSEGVAGGDPN